MQLLDRLPQEPELLLVPEGVAGGPCRAPQELRALRARRRDLERLLGEHERLIRGAERGRPFGCLPEPVPRPGSQRVGVGTGRRRAAAPRRSARPRRRPARRPRRIRSGGPPPGVVAAIGLREHPVGDLPDDALDERVLAAFGGTWIGLEREELLAGEVEEPRLERCGIGIGHGREGIEREAPPEDRRRPAGGRGPPARARRAARRSARAASPGPGSRRGRPRARRRPRRVAARHGRRASGSSRRRTAACPRLARRSGSRRRRRRRAPSRARARPSSRRGAVPGASPGSCAGPSPSSAGGRGAPDAPG